METSTTNRTIRKQLQYECNIELATKGRTTTLAILLQLMGLPLISLEPVVILILIRIQVLELILVHVLVKKQKLDPRQVRITPPLDPSTDN